MECEKQALHKQDANDNIDVQIVKKTKKQEPKIFPSLMLVDKEAFESCGQSNTKFIMKEFWNSVNNKILIARKKDTQAIVGYAIFSACEQKDSRFGNKRIPSVYLMRIAVRINSQRQGIGRKLLQHLLNTYPQHALSLDVSTDNLSAVSFYRRNGLRIQEIYLSSPDNVEFALFETPLDKKAKKLSVDDPEFDQKSIQPYFNEVHHFKNYDSKGAHTNEFEEIGQSPNTVTTTENNDFKTEKPTDENKSQEEETKSSDKEQEDESIVPSSPGKSMVFCSPDVLKEKVKVSVELTA